MRIANIRICPISGIFIMMILTVIFAVVIAIFVSTPDNGSIDDKYTPKGMVTDTVYRIQYNPDYVYIFLFHDKSDEITYKVPVSENRIIGILEDSYNEQTPIKIYYYRKNIAPIIYQVEYVTNNKN